MQVSRLIATFFLTSVMAASAAAFDTKPGEWEMETVSGGIPGMVEEKQKLCVTPEQAKDRYRAESEMNKKAPPNCTTKFSNEANTFTFEVLCDENGVKVDTKGVVKKVNEDEVVMDTTVERNVGDQKQTHNVTVKQKFISATCSKEAVPLPDGK